MSTNKIFGKNMDFKRLKIRMNKQSLHFPIIIALAVIFFLSGDNLFAKNYSLTSAPKANKISDKLTDRILSLPAENKLKVWILFTDKGLFDNTAYRTAVNNVQSRFSAKSLNRRINRTRNSELFDFYDLPVFEEYIGSIKALGIEISRTSRWLNAVSVYADYEAVEKISRLPFVKEIRPVAVSKRQPIEADEDFFKPDGAYKQSAALPDSVIDWYGQSYVQLNQINVPIVHQTGYTGQGVLIAVFDTGYDIDLAVFDSLNLCDSCKYDFINNDTSVGDALNHPDQPAHGTTVLSVIGGRVDSTLIGPAYNADYLLAKTEIVGQEIQAEEDNWIAASEWADSLGADIITSSLGYFDWYTYSDLDGQTTLITIAAEIAVSRGIAVFNAAGNERNLPWHYITPPADGPSVMAVGGVTSSGSLYTSSSPGPTYDGRIKPDIAAMAVNVCGVSLGGSIFCNKVGTSFATPLSAGAAALLLEIHPTWTPDDLREAMIQSANRYSNPDNDFGYGIFDTFKAAGLELTIDSIAPIILLVGDSLEDTVYVSGLEDTISISLTAENLPLTATFTDLGDRRAILSYRARLEDVGTRWIALTASSGTINAQRQFPLSVVAVSKVAVGPNPFSDSLTIFLGTEPVRVENIAIFSVSGEKVWDNYSDIYKDGIGTIVWHGVNNSGTQVADGAYFLLVETDRATHKIKVFKR